MDESNCYKIVLDNLSDLKNCVDFFTKNLQRDNINDKPVSNLSSNSKEKIETNINQYNDKFMLKDSLLKFTSCKLYKELLKLNFKKEYNASTNNNNSKHKFVTQVIFQEDIIEYIKLFSTIMQNIHKNPYIFISKVDTLGCNLLHYCSVLDYDQVLVYLIENEPALMSTKTTKENLTVLEISASKWNYNTLNSLFKIINNKNLDKNKVDINCIKNSLNLALDTSIFVADKNIEVLYLLLKQLRIEFMIDHTSEKIFEAITNDNILNQKECVENYFNMNTEGENNIDSGTIFSKNEKFIKIKENEQNLIFTNHKSNDLNSISMKNEETDEFNVNTKDISEKSDNNNPDFDSINSVHSVNSISCILNSIKTNTNVKDFETQSYYGENDIEQENFNSIVKQINLNSKKCFHTKKNTNSESKNCSFKIFDEISIKNSSPDQLLIDLFNKPSINMPDIINNNNLEYYVDGQNQIHKNNFENINLNCINFDNYEHFDIIEMEKEENSKEKNISTIQSCVRSWLKRNKYIDLKRNTMKLQAKLKNFLDRKKFVNIKNATITIQKAFRGFIKKK